MNYNVFGPDEAVYGPVDADTLKRWAAEGRVLPTTMIQEVGSDRKFAASTMPDLFPPARPTAHQLHSAYDAPEKSPVSPVQPAPGASGPGPSGFRASPATGYASAAPQEPVNSHIFKSAFALIACLPLGIAAIVFAVQVGSKQQAGDYYGARDSANKANICANIAIGLFVLGLLALVGLYILGTIMLRSHPAGGLPPGMPRS